jgi:hypothetical protein
MARKRCQEFGGLKSERVKRLKDLEQKPQKIAP